MAPDKRYKSAKPKGGSGSPLQEKLDQRTRELRDALERQAATNEILRLIRNSPSDAQPVFEAIVKSGAKLFPGAAVAVGLPRGDEVDAVAVADEDPIRAKAWRNLFPVPLTRDYMHGVAMLDGRELDYPDMEKAPNKDSAGARNFRASGYRAVAMMPMLRDGEAIGVISVVRVDPGPLSNEQLAVLRTFASQAVIAIENTKLLNKLRQTNATLENVSRQLAKYISPQLYQSIIDGRQDVKIESTRKKLTIFFSDIEGFAEITDQLESEELTALLNEYLTEMSGIAERHGANFDKFIGDAIMCYFGDPETRGVKEDADACLRMALDMRERLHELQSGWQDRGLIDRPFRARMGINTGYCTVGNFGSQDRMDYTIIGHEVNLAARLEANAEPGGILLAAETYSLVKDWLLAEEREALTVKGFAQPVRTYRVMGTHTERVEDDAYFHYADAGVTISIEGSRADKTKLTDVLKRALKQFDG
jgi:class 3 adenylate cyclase